MARLAFVLLFLASTAVEGQTADTIYTKHSLLDGSDAVLAAGFIAGTALAAPLDRWTTRQLQDDARQANRVLNRGAAVFRVVGHPGAIIAGAGLYTGGLLAGDRRVEDLGLHTLESVVVAEILTSAVKVAAGRARPYASPDNARNFKLFRGLTNDDYKSFPSGHSTAAFAFASTVTAETSLWWKDSRWIVGPIMYGAAALTGVSRIYNNQHWASDIVAGAAIGTFTGLKIFRYQHSHPDNWLDRKFLRAGISVSNNGTIAPIVSMVRR
ncbi:MAG TPA: phosphatase PAP2 family protein [Gemmatimonadaceae bacterium]